jgi:hypothetical protein
LMLDARLRVLKHTLRRKQFFYAIYCLINLWRDSRRDQLRSRGDAGFADD